MGRTATKSARVRRGVLRFLQRIQRLTDAIPRSRVVSFLQRLVSLGLADLACHALHIANGFMGIVTGIDSRHDRHPILHLGVGPRRIFVEYQGAVMRTTIALILVAAAGLAYGKLPPTADATKAQAAQTAAKAAWDDKVSLYKT